MTQIPGPEGAAQQGGFADLGGGFDRRYYSLGTGQMRIQLQLVHEQCARVLRAIGQDLTPLFPDRLEIVNTDGHFVARGLTRFAEPRSQKVRSCWTFKHATKAAEQSHESEFVRTYTTEDIERLDSTGAIHRTGEDKLPDLYSLPERLRIIGRIVDGKNAELIKLSQDGNMIIFEYRDQHGDLHSEAYSNLTVHKLQQQYYASRQAAPKDIWESAAK